MSNWGATKADWDTLGRLAPRDLWPTVNHPALIVARTKNDPGGYPTEGAFAKVPSQVTTRGEAARIPAWTKINSTDRQREIWRQNPDLGFGVVCRTIKAIDIDIDDPDFADEVDDAICDLLDVTLPARTRSNSGSRVLLYRLEPEERVRSKRVVKTGQGAVEFLFDRQFVALAGVHRSGKRQEYPDGQPSSLEDIPLITAEQLEAVQAMLQEDYAVDGPDSAATYAVMAQAGERRAEDADEQALEDMIDCLQRQDMLREVNADGTLSVYCPWQEHHTSTGGAPDHDPSAVKLFPPGVGGFDRWAFKCMHTSHGEKNFQQFAEAVGFVPDEFPVVESISEEQDARPDFENVSKTGLVPSTTANIVKALMWSGCRVTIQMDEFQGVVMTAFNSETDLRPIRDTDYVRVQLHLSRFVNMTSVSTQKVREAVHFVAEHFKTDTALDWINSLQWDGVDRISGFATRVLGADDTLYSQAVANYLWTALAARCLDPGVKADMTPVLIGAQGIRKSTAIQSIAPTEQSFLEVDLASRDDDLARTLRGRLVVEAGELRGFNQRDDNEIKSWLTRQEETWIPKYQEHFTTYKRRFIVIGSSNNPRFLQDPTGNRRWLPLVVGRTRPTIDTDYIKNNVTQLWAQAKVLYETKGILFQEAEALAPAEHLKHVRLSAEEQRIRQWLRSQPRDGWDTVEIMENALGFGLSNSRARSMSAVIENAMVRLGYEQGDDGQWTIPFV